MVNRDRGSGSSPRVHDAKQVANPRSLLSVTGSIAMKNPQNNPTKKPFPSFYHLKKFPNDFLDRIRNLSGIFRFNRDLIVSEKIGKKSADIFLLLKKSGF